MKKIIVSLLICAMLVSVIPSLGVTVTAENYNRDLGNLYVSKINGIWSDPTSNCLILLTPGYTVDGVYYHRLYAKYDSSLGGYIVTNKTSSHRSCYHSLASDEIGICFNFSPLTTKGQSEALRNWPVWNKIREGDLLTLSGINVSAKTAEISGTWGTSSFVSNAKINVKTSRPLPSGTAYSDKVIVALGDSITSNGGWTEIIGDDLHCEIINAGAGGDTAGGAINRFSRDVTPHNPDIVLIMFGVNDFLSTSNVSTGVTNYKNNLRTLYNKCTALGAKVMFMISNKNDFSSYESTYASQGGVYNCFKQYLNAMKSLAQETGSPFVDNYTPFEGKNITDYLVKNDFSHPNAAGYAIMIEQIKAGLVNNCKYFTGKSLLPEMALTAEAAKSCEMTSDGYLTGIKPGMTADQVKALFSTDIRINGTAIVTGVTVDGLDADGKVIKTVTIIIKGDVNCDGSVDQTDYLKIKSILKKTSSGDSAAALKAADTTRDGRISVTDYIAVRRQFLGTYNMFA